MMRWKKAWTLLIGLFLTLRLVCSGLGAVIASGPDPEPLATGPIYTAADALLHQDRLSHLLINVWERWDTGWYLKIAGFGYNAADGTVSFMPLYPGLVHVVGALIGNELLAALLISSLACLLTILLFYEVALREGLGETSALWASFFFAFFPSFFFLFAAYTDSLFLALALGTWLAARDRHWLVAGLLGSLATLCRLQGAVLSPVLGWAFLACAAGVSGARPLEQVRQVAGLWTDRSGRRSLRAALKNPVWLALLLPALTFLFYSLYLHLSGLGSIPATLEQHWGIRTVPPWTGFGLFLQRLVTTPRVFIDWVDLASLVTVLVLLGLGLRRLDPALSLYSWLALALFFMRGTPPHLLDSFNRYLLSLFPIFLILGGMRNRFLRLGWWAVSFGLQIFLLLGFLDWRWVD
jgi:hypothetical protein